MTWVMVITILLTGQTARIRGYHSEADCKAAVSHIIVRSGKDAFKADCRGEV